VSNLFSGITSAVTSLFNIGSGISSSRKARKLANEQLAFEKQHLKIEQKEMQAEAEETAKAATDKALLVYKQNQLAYNKYYGTLIALSSRGESSRGGFTTGASFTALNRNAVIELSRYKQDVIEATKVEELDFTKMNKEAAIRALGISTKAAATNSKFKMEIMEDIGGLTKSFVKIGESMDFFKSNTNVWQDPDKMNYSSKVY
jgi:hypothetical protein